MQARLYTLARLPCKGDGNGRRKPRSRGLIAGGSMGGPMESATAEPQTVPAFFQAALERLGDKPILEDRAGQVTIGTLLTDAAAAAQALERRGVRAGDRVGLWADNSRRWILADLAIQVAGCTLSRHLDYLDNGQATQGSRKVPGCSAESGWSR